MKRNFEIIPARPAQYTLFFAMSPEKDVENRCIGHVRMDFGHNGTEFWTTWHKRGPEEWNDAAFKSELSTVVDFLRESVLKDFPAMLRFCNENGGEIDGGWVQNYGYIVETENFRYFLRCNPVQGDYQAYLTCFKK